MLKVNFSLLVTVDSRAQNHKFNLPFSIGALERILIRSINSQIGRKMRFFSLTFLLPSLLPNKCYSRERYNEGFRFKAKLMTPVSLNDTLRQVYDTNNDFLIKQVFFIAFTYSH